MPSGTRVYSYAGHLLSQAPYRTEIERGQGVGDIYSAQAVEVEIPGRFASFVRAQPKSKDFTLNIYLENGVAAGYTKAMAEKQLFKWFDPSLGPDYLVVKSPGNGDLRLLILPVKLSIVGPDHYAIGCHAFEPVWESVGAQTASQSITTIAPSITIVHDGDTQAYPVITITPTALKANTTFWRKRHRISLVNKSEYPLGDPVNPDGYPIRFDISDLIAYPPEEIRLTLSGRQIPRWITSDATGLWANLRMRAAVVATLALDIDANIDSLQVNNPEGFSQWPLGSGFFLLDSERIGYAALAGFAASGLERGSDGTNNTAHSAGAILYWIEHTSLDVLYDFTGIEGTLPVASIEIADLKPLIDLDASTNALHVWNGPFINGNDQRSRAFELVFSDDGLSAQHVRVYNDPNTFQLTFEDFTPEAGKPAYNNAEIKFPVPLAASGASLTLDLTVDPSMALQIYVTDLGGNETRLLAQFASAPLVGVQFPLANPVTMARFNARIGAILGDVSLTDISVTDVPRVGFVFLLNPLGALHPEVTGAIRPIVLPTGADFGFSYYPCTHFRLDKETSVDGVTFHLEPGSLGSFVFEIYSDNSGVPNKPVARGLTTFDTPFAGGLVTHPFNPPLALPAGDYWFVGVNGRFGTHGSRTNANVWFGMHVLKDKLPSPVPNLPGVHRFVYDNPTTHILETADVAFDSSGPQYHVDDFTKSPVFAVVSKTTLAQNDAPLLTGNKIIIPNVTAVLDANRAPKIVMGSEEAAYVTNARIRNETTGDFLDIFFPLALNQSIVIDCKNRTITDNETGEPIPFALLASNPDVWLYLLPDENVISFVEDGLIAVTMSVEWRKALL